MQSDDYLFYRTIGHIFEIKRHSAADARFCFRYQPHSTATERFDLKFPNEILVFIRASVNSIQSLRGASGADFAQHLAIAFHALVKQTASNNNCCVLLSQVGVYTLQKYGAV